MIKIVLLYHFCMNKQNYHFNHIDLEEKTEDKYKKRDERKKRKMKVSGVGVKTLQKIIRSK